MGTALVVVPTGSQQVVSPIGGVEFVQCVQLRSEAAVSRTVSMSVERGLFEEEFDALEGGSVISPIGSGDGEVLRGIGQAFLLTAQGSEGRPCKGAQLTMAKEGLEVVDQLFQPFEIYASAVAGGIAQEYGGVNTTEARLRFES